MNPRNAICRALVAFIAALAISPGVAADWRTFFHGPPPAPTKSPPPKQLARVSTDPGSAADPMIEGFMRALADGIMARDGSPLLTRLSDKYAIDDLPADFKASDLFLQAVAKIPGPTEIVIKSVERRNDARLVKAEFRYEDETKVRTFWFDAGGKLLRSDLFGLKRQSFGG